MSHCPYCNSATPDQYNFCINCEMQIKCLQCGVLLVANKSRCLGCGKRIEEHNAASGAINKFFLEESQTTETASRKIEGHFTDTAIGQVAAILGGLSNYQVMPISQVRNETEVVRPALLDSHPVSLGEVESSVEPLNNGNQVIRTVSETHSSELEKAQQYFELDNENDIVARLSDFKGMNKQEQQKRFMVLYVWAYGLIIGKPEPSRRTIMNALATRGFSDSNSSKHFIDIENKYFTKVGEGYKINRDGDREVDRIIDEIEDHKIKGFQDWGKVKSREKPSRLNKDISDRIDKWVDMPIDINNFDIRTLKTPTNYALFAIWLLTSQLDVDKAVQSVEIFNYLARKFTHVPVKQENISAALKRPYNASFIERTADGKYYLTPVGEEKVTSWVQKGLQVDASSGSDVDEEGDNE
jgi:hypothetical protein